MSFGPLDRLRFGWAASPPSPWAPDEGAGPHYCIICRWAGDSFIAGFHSEATRCPQCSSIARDRFLFWCFITRSGPSLGARLLETSPRLGDRYRRAMRTWFGYVCSDYDLKEHKGTVHLDLQDIAVADGAFDMIVTPHVLEHVPRTHDALMEIARVLRPGGRMYLQVPVLQGHTTVPTEPEFHDDDTPVFWRFGWDLTAMLREHGILTSLLCTQEWADVVRSGATEWPGGHSSEFDVPSMLADAVADDLVVVADRPTSWRHGFLPAYMYSTWECIRP